MRLAISQATPYPTNPQGCEGNRSPSKQGEASGTWPIYSGSIDAPVVSRPAILSTPYCIFCFRPILYCIPGPAGANINVLVSFPLRFLHFMRPEKAVRVFLRLCVLTVFQTPRIFGGKGFALPVQVCVGMSFLGISMPLGLARAL